MSRAKKEQSIDWDIVSDGTPRRSRADRRKKKKKRLPFVPILALYLLVVAAAAVLLDGRSMSMELMGEPEITVSYGMPWKDPGAAVYATGKVFRFLDQRTEIFSEQTVDPYQLGTVELSYTATLRNETQTLTRLVHVVDDTAPELVLKPAEEEYNWFTGYTEPGYEARDNRDGDLTDKVVATRLDDRIVYSVTDSSGNETVAERTLQAVQPPIIELEGGEHISVGACMSFTDPGYRAYDALGTDLTELVAVTGSVTSYIPATYTLHYSIDNGRGDSVTVDREVEITAIQPGTAVLPDAPTIYLTFDDGPGPYTGPLLDILAKYGVKATFFVTGIQPDYVDMIGRAYEEGHAIGVHSYTHDYRKIYASEKAFFDDFNAMQEIIKEQTGSTTKLFRFPGGSSNTVSSFNPGIMSRLVKSMRAMGYEYFDWNVSSGDAGGTTSTDQVYRNVTQQCSNFTVSVVLQHDIKDFSVAAVESIIQWGIANGYQFAALDENCYAAHHGLNN